MRRKASMNCRSAGAIGFLRLYTRPPGSDRLVEHSANGAKVRIVTDRYSGLEVEFVEAFGMYRKGQTIVVGRHDFKLHGPDDEMLDALLEIRKLSTVIAGGRRR